MRFIHKKALAIALYLFTFYMVNGCELEPNKDTTTPKSSVIKHIERIKILDQQNKNKKHVVILGAGIAGLTAALELNNLGYSVEIIEASDRCGGRIWTHIFESSGQYGELGAMRIPASHNYTRHYIEVAGLTGKLRPFITANQNENCFYHLRGQPPIRMRESKKFIEKEYRLSSHEQKILSADFPPEILRLHLVNAINLLRPKGETVPNSSKTEDWEGLFGTTFLNDHAREFENISLGDFLEKRLGSQDAKELIGSTTGLELWWDKALTMFLREGITDTGTGLEEIAGGLSTLPNKLAQLLSKRKNVKFTMNTEVTSIKVLSSPKQKIKLKLRQTDKSKWDSPHTNDKGEKKYVNFVLCTIPFGVLRTMDLKGFGASKMEAIRNLTYASSTKVLLHFKDRFWERGSDQEQILGGASMSDQITRCTYYPSDHATSESLVPPEEEKEFNGVFTVSTPLKIVRSFKFPLRPEPIPGVLLGSYNWGQDAIRLGTNSPERRAEIVLNELEKFHPEIRQYLDDKEPSQSIFWDSYPWSRGAFCGMRPNDMKKYYYASKKNEGNLYFAGEHCSLDPGWIQGAIKSALDAVEEIVKANPT